MRPPRDTTIRQQSRKKTRLEGHTRSLPPPQSFLLFLTNSAPTVTPMIRNRTPQPDLISVSESSEDTHMSPTGSYPPAMSSGIPCEKNSASTTACR